MALTDQGIGRTYKIKLVSGRILGPIDSFRIKRLILKNQIVGKEVARIHPDGEWVDINEISEIAELLLAHASGSLVADPEPPKSESASPQVSGSGGVGLSKASLVPIQGDEERGPGQSKSDSQGESLAAFL